VERRQHGDSEIKRWGDEGMRGIRTQGGIEEFKTINFFRG
jgi:hypothetical protein